MKLRKSTLVILLLLSVAIVGFGQNRNCGTMEYLDYQYQQDPAQEMRMQAIERFTQRAIQQRGRSVEGVITIPVVVHVVYHSAAENISDAQIHSQIDILNEDFRRLNSDADDTWPQAADSEIEFCLAKRDPFGNATNGITRTATHMTSFSANNDIKYSDRGGKDAWPAADYLNIWVGNMSGVLGYAQFPGGTTATDGIVCDYEAFGSIGTADAPFNLGRTATHEVGHWLNLRHIWGDGDCSTDDYVADTPASDAYNGGCAVGHVSCSSRDMVQNYMDYSDDACMNLFTQGQKDRMRALFRSGGPRASLLSSPACQSGAPPACDDGVQNGDEAGIDCGGSCPTVCPTCTDGIQNGDETDIDCGGTDCLPCPCLDNELVLTLILDNYPEETSWSLVNADGTTLKTGGPYGYFPDGSTVVDTFCLPAGCYDFIINDSYGDGICCGYGNGSYSLADDLGEVLIAGGEFGTSETRNFCIGDPPAPTCDDGIQNGDETGVDCGGACPDPCGSTTTVITGDYFETGWGNWTDGGSDCYRYPGGFAYEGKYAIRLRDNSGERSAMTSVAYDVSAYDQLEINFYFYPNSMETGEDFWVRYYDGSSWHTVATYAEGTSFNNGGFYVATIQLDRADYSFPANARFRFQCDASSNSDQVYIDAVTISGMTGAHQAIDPTPSQVLAVDGRPESAPPISKISSTKQISELGLYPNPVSDRLYLQLPAEQTIRSILIVNSHGKRLSADQHAPSERQLSVAELPAGFYLLVVETNSGTHYRKFIKR